MKKRNQKLMAKILSLHNIVQLLEFICGCGNGIKLFHGLWMASLLLCLYCGNLKKLYDIVAMRSLPRTEASLITLNWSASGVLHHPKITHLVVRALRKIFVLRIIQLKQWCRGIVCSSVQLLYERLIGVWYKPCSSH